MGKTPTGRVILKDPSHELPPLLLIFKRSLTEEQRQHMRDAYYAFLRTRAAMIECDGEVYQCIGGRWIPLKPEPEPEPFHSLPEPQ